MKGTMTDRSDTFVSQTPFLAACVWSLVREASNSVQCKRMCSMHMFIWITYETSVVKEESRVLRGESV